MLTSCDDDREATELSGRALGAEGRLSQGALPRSRREERLDPSDAARAQASARGADSGNRKQIMYEF
eukprot:3190849-Prymnesium_polylepis.1